MKIKMKKMAMVAGFSQPVPKDTVVESDNPGVIGEFKALIQAGYASPTNEAVSDPEWQYRVGSNTPPQVSGIMPKTNPDDAHNALLSGTVADVEAGLASYDDAGLTRLAELEGASEKPRVGVLSAIDKARSALNPQ